MKTSNIVNANLSKAPCKHDKYKPILNVIFKSEAFT